MRRQVFAATVLHMASNPRATARYEAKRGKRNPPHVPLAALRAALGLTVETVLDRVEEETGKRPSRGTISAIENGHRGASVQMLAAFEIAYGLPDGSITTDYEPRAYLDDDAA